MRCFICNAVVDEPHYNQDHQDYDPCNTCKTIIDDLLAGYGDRPAVPDDAPLDPVLEGLYPLSYDPFETETEA